MRVVVTGGAGYVGSVVSEVLLEEGHRVLVVDNLVKGFKDAIPEGASFEQLDLLDQHRVAAALRRFGCEAVVHMAAHSLVGESVVEPAKYYRNNITAGLALLDSMRAAGVDRLVFSSTAAVYGEPVKQPIDETDGLSPTNPYGATKLAFEQALHWYGRAYGLRSISLRYFNAAGATAARGERHDPETHLIPLVLDAAAGLTPHVTIFGDDYPTPDGTCVRDYVHVWDLARAHVLALFADLGPGEVRSYNLGCGGAGFSVQDVVAAARRVTCQPIPVVIADRRPGDPATLVASSNRIERELGWWPLHQSLDDIIGSAWVWHRYTRPTARAQQGDGGRTPPSDRR
jgi:UDP-glucose 4-epimerase